MKANASGGDGGDGASRQPGGERIFGRSFRVVCFGWGGTAVPDRKADAGPVRNRVERLAALGVDVVVISGSDVATVDGQLHARPAVEGHVFYLLSLGSEAYVVGPAGPRLLERRRATAEEERQLSRAAEAVRDELVARGLGRATVSRRLNRRVVGLLAGRRGAGKSADEKLRRVVAEKFAQAGLHTPGEAIAMARELALQAGMSRPRVGVGAGRLDIGLTDKADSMRWLLEWVLRDRGIEPSDLLALGDEFGSRGGEGGDARMLVPEMRKSTYVSLGDEPEGVPRRVRRMGGGPPHLLRILDEQIALRVEPARESFPVPSRDPTWLFAHYGFDPFREREVETWFTIANGETGTRGSLEEGSHVSTPATFVAGVYGDDTSELHIRQPVPAPDWLCLRLLVDGMHLNLANGEIVEHRRVLDLSQGIVFRSWRQRDRIGRETAVRTARFASLADRSLLALRAEATPRDFCGRLTWEACVGVSYAGGAVLETAFETRDGAGFVARTKGRRGGGHVMAVSTHPAPGSPVARYLEQTRDVIGGRLECDEPATIDRLAAVVASPARIPSSATAVKLLARGEQLGFDELLRRHREAWSARWADARISLDGDDESQFALRFSVYHMISSGHPTRDSVSVGARGLSGMSYFCHVFWDTEIFVVPFFIYTHPETARTLLAYRYRNLDGARRKARHMGHRGALFPWESADSGDETTPPYGIGRDGEKVPILSGLLEHHISADVAWAVWEYWKATGDDEFMRTMGVELLLETARFWVSRTVLDADGRYHVPMVVGPDEYHEGVDDNAYTNVLARRNIARALEAFTWLETTHADEARSLAQRIAMSVTEMFAWRRVIDGLADGFDPETGLYEQFAGFFDLDEVDPEAFAVRPMAADLLLGRDVTHRSKVIKQADVVMLCYLLPDEIDAQTARANLDYYEPITAHGSSLSPGIHAALAARLGQTELAYQAFRMAADIDLSDNMGNAARGLHLATMGGLWQAAVMGFGGVRRRGEALVIDPHLPREWSSLSFRLRFRGARLGVTAGDDTLDVSVEERAVTLVLGRRRRKLVPGTYRFRRGRGASWKEAP